MTRCLISLLALMALVGCGEEAIDPPGTPLDGSLVYAERFDDGNVFACATCHALSEPAADGITRAGHPIGDAFARSTYKGGQLTELRDAVNSCVSEWMNATPLDADDPRWVALESFLAEQAPGDEAPAVPLVVSAPPQDLSGGDPVEGEATFNRTCSSCHGDSALGSGLAPALVGSMVDAETVARRVRTSGRATSEVYDGLTGGVMPFWAEDRLSDEELLDVVAFAVAAGEVERMDMMGGGGDGGRECESTHSKVGQSAELSNFSHDIGGTARIVDDCTIEIENFSFDGGGIDVQIYAGLGGNYNPPVGFSVSPDIFGTRYDGTETLRVQLPEDKTLDDLDGVSVWCVAVGISFGDGIFQ